MRVKGVGGNFVASRDQLAQDGALANNFSIAPDVAGTWHILSQGIEIAQATHALCFALIFQLLEHRDDIGWLGAIDQC